MYGCPNCGSELLYDIKLGRLKCRSCRSSFDVDSIKREKDAEQDLYEIQAFRCPQCGGEIYTNDHTIAGFCSYCGASAVLQQRTEQIKVPFRIFPFTVDKKDCRKRFREFIAKCSYVPEEYKNPEAEHEFRGIYVPSHSYEAEAGGAYQLKGKTTTVAGPSGVGKSSLINLLSPEAEMETGDISRKIERGKHTTRHSELFALDENTFICDTPGFSSIYLPEMEKEELGIYFPEIAEYEPFCRFQGCAHIHEPGCGVKEALEEKKISPIRYDNYKLLYEELKDKRRY